MSPPALRVLQPVDNDDHQPCSPVSLDSTILTTTKNKDRRPSVAFQMDISSSNSPPQRLLDTASTDTKLAMMVNNHQAKQQQQQEDEEPTKPVVIAQRKNSKAGIYERRRSSVRKSVNGLVIEFDLEDEDEVNTFALCDDYVEDMKPSMEREESNGSLEELRTRLEALEHERNSQQLPEHDDYGWGRDCVNKKMLEALEGHQSMTSMTYYPADNDEGDKEEEEGEESHPSEFRRRSTARNSINGLVLEYDFSDSEDEGEQEDE